MPQADFNYELLAEELGIKGRVSSGQLYATCPLHVDSNPSFSLHLESGRWTCHAGSCQAQDYPHAERTFSKLVQLVWGVSLREALQWMTERGALSAVVLNDRLKSSIVVPEEKPHEEPNESLMYYHSLVGDEMPTYWFERGFDWDDVRNWSIRFDALNSAIVIPVFDIDGNQIGHIKRNLRSGPKYVNARSVSRALFGAWKVKQGSSVVLCEGPLDAIWLHKHGYAGIAILGDSLTEEQINDLNKLQPLEVTLGFDSDKAGEAVTWKAASALMKRGYLMNQIKCVEWPRKDPQECSASELKDALGDSQIFALRSMVNGRR